jgi:hypothetical protein
MHLTKEDQDRIRGELSDDDLEISKGQLMFDNVDSFVTMSRDNTSVIEADLYPFDSDPGNYEFWDKAGQIVGNLMELRALNIHFLPSDDYGGDEVRMHDWEILTRILRKLRRKVALRLDTEDYDAEVEEIQGLARAIHGHPMISGFQHSPTGFTFANLAPWCSSLATLPSLETVILGLQEPETEEQRDLVNLEPLKELLRAPALRCVTFDSFYFTNALCHVVASALEEGSSVIDISFDEECTFPDGGRAIIANALKINASVTHVKFLDECDEPVCNTLAAVLLCNSTLQNLSLELPEDAGGRWISSIFLSLGTNTTLKSLSVRTFDKFGDELCAAIRNGLAPNSTLEELSLYNMFPIGDDGAVSARNALSFLRTNTALKSLTVSFFRTLTRGVLEESYVSPFRLEAVKLMEDNSFLESLTIDNSSGSCKVKFEDLLEIISALQLNTTLKTLGFQCSDNNLYFTDNEVSQLVPILMKNYGLEHLVPDMDIRCSNDRTVKAILRLNGAGRRYLIKDGSSISKGVEVLNAVNDDINCVFLHLLENPGLCNRRAVDATMRSRRLGANLDESSSRGKRERPL